MSKKLHCVCKGLVTLFTLKWLNFHVFPEVGFQVPFVMGIVVTMFTG